MRAVVCPSFDGIEALALDEIADPVPGPGQVLVDVRAAAVSFMDTLMVAGRYQLKPVPPFVPGTDCAGVVLAVGDGVRRIAVGDRVACSVWHGAMAERLVAAETAVVKLPEGIGFEIGSTVRYAYGTARYALVARAQLQAHETVFVSGAAGAVGMATIDIARQLGATVIAGASSPERCDIARRHGAVHAIDYAREPVRERLLALTEGRGVDVFFDNVGGPLFAAASRAMAWGGRVLPIGFTSGEIPSLAMNLPLLKGYSVVGCNWGAWMEREPERGRAADEAIFAEVASGSLRPQAPDVLPMSAFAAGLQRLARREMTARVVLRIQGAPPASPLPEPS